MIPVPRDAAPRRWCGHWHGGFVLLLASAMAGLGCGPSAPAGAAARAAASAAPTASPAPTTSATSAAPTTSASSHDWPGIAEAAATEIHAALPKGRPGHGTTDYPGHAEGDVPKAYAMVLLAELERLTSAPWAGPARPAPRGDPRGA